MALAGSPGGGGASRQRLYFQVMVAGTLATCLALFFGFFAIRAYRDPYRRSDIRIEGDWMIQADEVIGFVAAKNAATTVKHLSTGRTYHVYTDRRGARVSRPGAQTPERVDLLTVGCSFSWGDGVEAVDTFTERLGRRLGIATANLALAAYSGLNALQALQRNLDLKPKVIVYGFIETHRFRNLSSCAPSYPPYCMPVSYVSFDGRGRPRAERPHLEYFSPELYRQYYREVLSQEASFTLADVLWRIRVDLLQYPERRRLPYPTDLLSQRKGMNLVLREMVEATHSAGARLVVVYIPSLERGRAGPPPRPLLDAMAGRDLVYLSLEGPVRDYYGDPGRPPLNLPNDAHPAAVAHELIARELEGPVSQLLRAPNVPFPPR